MNIFLSFNEINIVFQYVAVAWGSVLVASVAVAGSISISIGITKSSMLYFFTIASAKKKHPHDVCYAKYEEYLEFNLHYKMIWDRTDNHVSWIIFSLKRVITVLGFIKTWKSEWQKAYSKTGNTYLLLFFDLDSFWDISFRDVCFLSDIMDLHDSSLVSQESKNTFKKLRRGKWASAGGRHTS